MAQCDVIQNNRMSLSSGKTSWTCSCCAVYAAVSVSVPRSWRQELLCGESSRQTPLVPQWPCTGHSRALREARGAAGDTPAGEERPVWKSEEQPCEHPCGGRSGGRRRSGTGAGAVSVQADDSTSNGNEGVNGNGSSDADARLDILFYLVHRSLLSAISDSEKLWDGASERARDTGVLSKLWCEALCKTKLGLLQSSLVREVTSLSVGTDETPSSGDLLRAAAAAAEQSRLLRSARTVRGACLFFCQRSACFAIYF